MTTTGFDGLEARNLCIERGLTTLVKNLSFSASSGTLVHLKGPNGSGKTTAMRILSGLASAASGDLLWRSQPVAQAGDFYAALNFVGHLPGLSGELSAMENLRFICSLRHALEARPISEALQRLNARRLADRPIKQLSAGQRQRVALARLALFPSCQLWMLDEPFTALDSDGRQLLETLLDEHLHGGGIVIIATHQGFSSSHRVDAIDLLRGAA